MTTVLAWTAVVAGLSLGVVATFLLVVRFTSLGTRFGYATLARMLRPGARRLPPGTLPWNPYLFSIGVCSTATAALCRDGDRIRLVESLELASTPSLWAGDVHDRRADFVADPFVIHSGQRCYLFFEVKNSRGGDGEIGLATSPDGRSWTYEQIVLSEPFHLSYPYVFAHENNFFMVPESFRARELRLYRAADFPTRWELDCVLLKGVFIDPSPFFFQGQWYLYACPTQGCDRLLLYCSPTLRGPWQEHPQSPIVEGDPHTARPGGRVIVDEAADSVFSVRQDCYPTYGNRLHLFEVTRLSTTCYEERMVSDPDRPFVPRVPSGWNHKGVHHLDVLSYKDGTSLVVFDGCDTFY